MFNKIQNDILLGLVEQKIIEADRVVNQMSIYGDSCQIPDTGHHEQKAKLYLQRLKTIKRKLS